MYLFSQSALTYKPLPIQSIPMAQLSFVPVPPAPHLCGSHRLLLINTGLIWNDWQTFPSMCVLHSKHCQKTNTMVPNANARKLSKPLVL